MLDVKARVLVVDEQRRLPARVVTALEGEFEIRIIEAPSDSVLSDQGSGPYAAVVVGPGVRDPIGLSARVRSERIAEDVVVVATRPSLTDAIGAIRGGASDFVVEGDRPELVVNCVKDVVERRHLRNCVEGSLPAEAPALPCADLVGESEVMQRLSVRLVKVARSEATVLITGESGTGKELVARAVHAASRRRSGPFVTVTASAIPKRLFESELFGHTRGAFTDARNSRVGLLNQASGGTLLLDEVGDLPLDVQAKLLRALQQRAVRPLGSREETPFDARIVATTRLNLSEEVRRGTFREDLYFRLHVLCLQLPPLSQRGYDVLLLARHFLEQAGSSARPLRGMTPAAAHRLLAHDWPGNVRELEHCIMAAAAAARYDHLRAVDLPLGASHQIEPETSIDSDGSHLSSWSEVERSHILSVLKSVSGNKVLASKLLGLDRKTLARKLKRYDCSGVPRRDPLESHPDLSQ